ncbi:DNA/RNA non-specific endonuclease [Pseudoalteromonas rubra]|uniref:Uncharacterized protein n=1 Tax=Pseudoalteromonas rubra TaxID=43658 RepID=A0A5S3X2G5_9GAMM|nr:DNA/RNA non-specific endonuclease [Pseudoalteromonas rubra]TMP38343.1 hypothetical protein CWB98_06315 [Pseudoalteromonas rubra]
MKNRIENGDFEHKVPLWQKSVAILNIFLILWQVMLPSIAFAMTSSQINAELNNPQYTRVYNGGEYLYAKSDFVDNKVVSSSVQNIESFFNKLKTTNKQSLESPLMVPVRTGDITVIFPIYPLGERIGDSFVQSRFVRAQIYNQLNRNLLVGYTSESNQINGLYNNAYLFAKTGKVKFGSAVTRAQVNAFGSNFIWPEKRSVGGRSVLIPILHLTDSTITAQTVSGHQVEFHGNSNEFRNITVDTGNLYTYSNAIIRAANNVTVVDGAVIAKGDLNIVAGGTVSNLSSKFSAADNVNIFTNNYVQKTLVHRYETPYSQGSLFGNIARLDGNNIYIKASNDIVLEGASVSGNSITFNAANNIILKSAQASSSSSFSSPRFSEDVGTVENLMTELSVKDSIALMAGGKVELYASKLYADKGTIDILASNGIYIANEFDEYQASRQKKWGKTTVQEQEFETIAIRSALEAGKGIKIASDFGEITLKAADISSAVGTEIDARNGKVNFLLAKDHNHYFYNKVQKSTWKIKTETIQNTSDTAVYNDIVGGVKVNATHGIKLELGQYQGETVKEIIGGFTGTDSLGWMSTIYNDSEFACPSASELANFPLSIRNDADFANCSESLLDVAFQKLERIEVHERTSALSPAAMAVIAIAVSVAMGPGGMGWTGGQGSIAANFGAQTASGAITHTATSAMIQAAATTMASQAATSLASGKGLDGTIRTMLSSDGIRSLATAIATAGILNSETFKSLKFFNSADIGSALFESEKAIQLANQAAEAVMASTVRAGVSTIVDGGSLSDFSKSLTQSLATTAVNTLGDAMAKEIGISFKKGDINNLVRYIAHAGAGCVRGALTSEVTNANGGHGCASGAGGAVIGEMTADIYKASAIKELLEENKEVVDDLKAQGKTPEQVLEHFRSEEVSDKLNKQVDLILAAGVDYAKLSGALGAFAAHGDVDIAASAAEGAAANNAAFLIPIFLSILKAVDVALTAKELWTIYRAANGDPTALAKGLASFLGESALERIIPGFKTADEMIDWLKRNNYLNDKLAKQIKDIFDDNRKEGGNVDLPSGLLNEVHVPVGSKGNWDKRVNGKLEADTKYVLSNGHSYTTDAHGRVISVSGEAGKGVKLDRNTYQQTKTGHDGNAQSHELHDGGHLIATHLGGAGDKINMVPMTRELNRDLYRSMERELGQALKDGKEVYVDIKVGYPDNPTATRPNIIRVTAKVDGVPTPYSFVQ